MNAVELALSASGQRALCALRLPDGRVVGAPVDSSTRGTDLVPAIEALFAGQQLAPQAIQRIRVDVGPGSYTGLRVAITFARTTAAFVGAQLAQFTSLELLAHAAWARGDADPRRDLAVVLDARRERFHVGRLRLQDGVVTLLSAPSAVDLRALVAALGDRIPVVADAALHDILRPHADALLPVMPAIATDLLEPALAAREVSVDAIEPLYLMATYADG